jgi:formylmethanofuran:tetrahydromethanopterin formyltransferase
MSWASRGLTLDRIEDAAVPCGVVDVVEVEVRGVNVNSVVRQLNPAAQSSRELKPAGR